MTKFVQASDEALGWAIRGVKQGMMGVVDNPNALTAEMPEGLRGWVPPVEGFFVDLAILESLEKELKARGLNPADPVYGIDLLGEVAEVKRDLLLAEG